MSADALYTYGPPELCVWKVAPSTFWFQTTDSRYSRKLDQRKDTRRVAVTGVNHYRRTEHQRLEGQTRTGLSKAAATAAEHAGEMQGNEVLSQSNKLRDITHLASKVFGWDKKNWP
jgi:methylmalonyl-CoA mutase N-terminal domain/subunit